MRILLATSELAPWSGGGAGVAAAHLAFALHGAGHEVTLLTLAPDTEQPDSPGHAAPARPDLLGPVPIIWAGPREGVAGLRAYPCRPMREAMALHLAASDLHIRAPFDAIEFPDFGGQGYFALRARDTLGAYPGAVLAVRIHTPAFVSHEVNGTREVSRARATIEHMERDALQRAEVITSPSQAALGRVLAGLAPRASTPAVVPNSWSTEAERVLEAACAPPGPGTPELSPVDPAIVCVGRLEHQKGQDILARALASCRAAGRDLRAAFIGRETRLNPSGLPMRALLRDAGAREADFRGPLPRSDVRAMVSRASALIAPSRWDNMPYAVMEAMARGTPVIVSSAGGMPELVRDGMDGLVVRAEDPAAWRSAITSVLDDHDLRRTFSANARERITTLCNPAAVAEAWTRAIRAATTPSGTGPRSPHSPAGGARVAFTDDESVEVVVPHFEMADLLEETCACIRAQTRPPARIFVVDDGSRDAQTPIALARLEAAEVRVLRGPNRGPGAARRAGLHAARARYVMFVDADERLHPETIEKCLGAMRRNPALTYVSPLVRTFDASGPRPRGWVPLGPDRDFMWALNVGGAASGTLFDRARLIALDALDPNAPGYEDWDMFCTIASGAGLGEVIPEFLLEHRLRPGSRQQRDEAMHAELVAWLRRKHSGLATPRARALGAWLAARDAAQRLHEP